MNQRRHITLVSAGATMIAALPLAAVFERWTWLVSALLVVGTMTAVAVALRSVRAPIWAPTAGMIVTYLVTLTWLFSDGHALFGSIPTPETVTWFNKLLADAGETIRDSGVPVGDEDGLLFLAALGVGAVLLAVDLAAVVARRPAIAGIPMVAIYLVPVGTHTASVSFLAFVCTAAAFLWLLATDNVDRVRRFGRRFTGDGRDIDVWEPSPLAAAGRRLAVIGVAAAVVLPLAVPGMTSGLLDRFGTGIGDGPGTGTGPGRAGNVNLFSYLQGSLVRDTAYDMAKVTTTDPNPFYLRFGTADELTSSGFVNRPFSRGTALSTIQGPTQIAAEGVTYRAQSAQVEVLQFTEQVLPVYQQLSKVERVDSAWVWDRQTGVVYSNRSNAKGRKYTINFVRAEFTPDALRRAAPLRTDDQLIQYYTRMQDVPKVKVAADELVKGRTTQYDKVRAIYDFFSPANGFTYNLRTRKGNSGSDMVDFIDPGGRQGYCEQYAAAMAWLVRAAGIPARVAFGFTKGTKNGNTYTMSNFNLHAWTEVYFEGYGWVPFDATPAGSIAGSAPSAWAPDPTRPQGAVIAPGVDEFDPATNASGGASAAPAQQFGGNDAGTTDAGGGVGGSSGWRIYLLAGLVVLLVLLLLPSLRRAGLRRRRTAGTPPSPSDPAGVATSVDATGTATGGHRRARRDAHAAWDELLDTMIDFRVEIDPAETPRLTSARLITEARLDDAASQGMKVLSQAEERARYARSPLTDVDLATPLRDVRASLRTGVSRRTRILAAIMPPSVLARWRAALGTGYAAVVTGTGRRRDAVARAISPRRLLAGRSSR